MTILEAEGGRVRAERTGNTVYISLNDPSRLNPFSADVSIALDSLVAQAVDTGADAIIFWAEGRSFSSGADMEGFRTTISDLQKGDGFPKFYRSERALIRLAQNLKLPHVTSIAAVHGWTVGQGFELAASCDYIVAAEGTKFWMPETSVGWNVGMGTAQTLVKTVGLGYAKRILLLNEKIDARLAESLGLVTRIAPEGKQLEVARELLELVRKNAPMAQAFQKKLIDMATAMSLDDSRELEVITGHWLAYTSDVLEAATAFTESRSAIFKGM